MSDRLERNARTPEQYATDTADYVRLPHDPLQDEMMHEPTLGELFIDLSNDLSHLVRQELTLAKTEIRENLDRGKQGVVLMAAGGIMAFAGLLVLLAAVVILVALAVNSYWLAALIVGVVVIVIGLILFYSGKGKLDNVNLIPEKAINAVERDAKMAKEKLS